MALSHVILLVCVSSSLYCVGVIWFLQLNHYPLYASVGSEGFRKYIVAHNRRLLFPIIVPSLVAFASSVALAFRHPTEIADWSVWLVIACNAVTAVSTALVQGPAHNALARDGYSAAIVRRVLATNWLRTVAWTANGALLTWMTALTTSA